MSEARGLASPEDQNSQSCETLENSQVNESLENSQINCHIDDDYNLDDFEQIQEAGPIKIQEMVEPIIGTYLGSEEGKHSPYYSVETKNGVVKVVGVTDLAYKMEKVEIGDLVYISYSGQKLTDSGFVMHVADVRVKKQAVSEFALNRYGVAEGGN